MGYGAERANLISEAPVQINNADTEPIQATVASLVEEPGKNAVHSLADQRLAEAAQKAKTNLISEINQFNYITESSGSKGARGFEDELNSESLFNVCNPTKMKDQIGSVIKYTVTGQDSEGKFEIQRRYKEFDALHRTLNERWPGCYIPAIPEKAALDNKEEAFV